MWTTSDKETSNNLTPVAVPCHLNEQVPSCHVTFLPEQESHALKEGWCPLFLQPVQTDFAFRHSLHLPIAKEFEASLVTICVTPCWPFKQFSQVCTVLILPFMQENICSPVIDLGQKWTATGIAAPLSSEVAIIMSALLIRSVFIFSRSWRGCFFTNFLSTLCVRPKTCCELYSRPGFRAVPSLAKATGIAQTVLRLF